MEVEAKVEEKFSLENVELELKNGRGHICDVVETVLGRKALCDYGKPVGLHMKLKE